VETDFETYYQSAAPGGLACVCSRDPIYGERFFFVRIREIRGGRVYTARGVFWAVNGEKCDQGWAGDVHALVVPTIPLLEMVEPHLERMARFGVDRRFEIAVARAVLEGRLSEMPELPAPPVPTLKEAQAELLAATAYWEAVDVRSAQPGTSVRIRREASERLVAARTNLERAREQARRLAADRPGPPEPAQNGPAGPPNAVSGPYKLSQRLSLSAPVKRAVTASWPLEPRGAYVAGPFAYEPAKDRAG
jgi:hypothetical protein